MGRHLRDTIVVTLIGLVTIIGDLASISHAQPSPDRKSLASERLVMPLFPANWNEAHKENSPVEVVEYLPSGQTLNNWQDKIILQVYHDLNDLPLDAIQRRTQLSRCTGVIEGPVQSGLNNGYASAFWTLGCRYVNENRLGETQYTKAIQGQTALYVLSRVWRTPALGETVRQ